MAAPYNNLRSKLNRAIVAYLVSLNDASVGTVGNILPHTARNVKLFPYTVVRATTGAPTPPLTGNYLIAVHLSIRGSAVLDAGQTSEQANRVAFDARIASTFDAMMQTSDNVTLNATCALINTAGRALAVSDPTNNADMADFTLVELVDGGFGDGDAESSGCDWEEILIFNCLTCGSNVD